MNNSLEFTIIWSISTGRRVEQIFVVCFSLLLRSLKAAYNHVSFLFPQQIPCDVGAVERILREL